jgi:6-pyruvoyltetrahydropterin/6-carboxytetrahydropterin synthase
MMIIKYSFYIDAAHFLPNYVGKCKQMHGHTYTLEVSVEGIINPDTGMVMDFHQLKYIVQSKAVDVLDHRCLNDIIENPTAENVLLWVKEALAKHFDNVINLRLREGFGGWVELK